MTPWKASIMLLPVVSYKKKNWRISSNLEKSFSGTLSFRPAPKKPVWINTVSRKPETLSSSNLLNQKWPQDTASILHVSSPRPGSLMSFSCHLFRRRGNRCSIVLGARKSFLKDWHKQSPKRSPNLTKNKSLLRKKIDTKAIGEMEDWPGKIRDLHVCISDGTILVDIA